MDGECQAELGGQAMRLVTNNQRSGFVGSRRSDTRSVSKQDAALLAELMERLSLDRSSGERHIPARLAFAKFGVVEREQLQRVVDIDQSRVPQFLQDAAPASEPITLPCRHRRESVGEPFLIALGEDGFKISVLEHDLVERTRFLFRPESHLLTEAKMATADHVDQEPLAQPFADPTGDVVQQRYRSPGAAGVTDEQLDGDCRQKIAEFGEAMRVPGALVQS